MDGIENGLRLSKICIRLAPIHLTSFDSNERLRRQWHLIYSSLIIIFLIICTVNTPVLADENNTFTCGVILPLSGNLNSSGNSLLMGIQLAADEINKNGGAAGYQIALRVGDDQGDPQKALSLFKKMQASGIPVVIGSYTTQVTLPMAKETIKSKSTVLISPRANGEAVYGISPQFYQVNPPVFYYAKFVAEWLTYTSERAAVIYIDDEYGRSVLKGLKNGTENDIVSVTGSIPAIIEDTDYSALIRKMLNSAPDTIVIIVYDSRQIPLLRNLSDVGFRGQVIMTESGFIDTLEKDESDVLSKFSLFTIASNTNLVPGIQSEQFLTSYHEKFGLDPTRSVAGYGYDSMMLIADTFGSDCEKSNISAARIQKELDDSRYYGVTGPKVFDSHHAVGSVLDRWAFKDGKFKLTTISLY